MREETVSKGKGQGNRNRKNVKDIRVVVVTRENKPLFLLFLSLHLFKILKLFTYLDKKIQYLATSSPREQFITTRDYFRVLGL